MFSLPKISLRKMLQLDKFNFFHQSSIKLYTLRLANVVNCYDAHSLWDYRYAGQKDIQEINSGKINFRLKHALDKNRRMTAPDNETETEKIGKVFTDVIVWIPERIWQNELEVGADNIQMLARRLTRLHEQDFKSDLLAGRSPRYVIMPDPDLESDEVICQFGIGVYVPDVDEPPVAAIALQLEGDPEWHSLTPLYHFRDGREIAKPAGIYAGQQGLIIGPDRTFAALTADGPGDEPLWFSHRQGAVFINYALNREDFAFGDDDFIIKHPVREQHPDRPEEIIFRFTDKLHTPETPEDKPRALLLKITELSSVRKKPSEPIVPAPETAPEPELAPEPEPAPDAPDIPRKKTTSGGKETIELARPERPGSTDTLNLSLGAGPDDSEYDTPILLLEGLALPRIDKYKAPHLKYWILWLDADGKILENPSPDQQRTGLAVSAGSESSKLQIKIPGAAEFTPPPVLPWVHEQVSGPAYEILPFPENDFYIGVLMIPNPDQAFPLQHTTMTLGRDEHADIPLILLQSPATLHWESGNEKPDACLGLLHMARQHAEVTLKESDGTLELKNISKGSPLFIMTTENRFKKLEPDAHPAVLKPGERLVAGCCVLRYDNPDIETREQGRDMARFFQENRLKQRVLDHLQKNNLSAEQKTLMNHLLDIIDRHEQKQNLFAFSPETIVRDIDHILDFLELETGTETEITSLKQLKHRYLSHYE